MGLVAVAALVVIILFLRSPESPPVVISSLQITNDGTSKRSLVTDGTRLYFFRTSERPLGPDAGFDLGRRNRAGTNFAGQRRHLRFLPGPF